MTSAQQNVKLASGALDTNRWGFGAGHMNPNAALATKVVFDQTNAEHQAYYNGTLSGMALNLPSMTAGDVIGVQTFTRRLTNRGTASRTYTASATLPGFSIVVSPANFTIAPGATQTVSTTVLRITAAVGSWVFGEVVFAGEDGVNLRSPVTVRPGSFVGVASVPEVTDTRAVGTRVLTVGIGYTGSLLISSSGMVAAERLSGTVATGQRVCSPLPFAGPAGAKLLRAQMFSSETSGGATSDLDLFIQRGSTLLGSGQGATSDELVMISNPPAGADYQACVNGRLAAGGAATFTVNLWVVPELTSPSTLRAMGPANVVSGRTASVGLSWRVAAGGRHLGLVQYRETADGSVLGTTTVFVDATARAAAAAQAAPLLRDKPLH